jgi:type I restriction enzyme, S subunit
MNAEDLLKHFDRIAEAPDAVAHLRRFILDLAVRGKLVEQDPNDEPASELLRRIQAEKERLVQTGEIKKIERFEQSELTDLQFAAPTGWQILPMGWLARKLGAGSTPLGGKSVYQNEGIPFLRSQNVHNDGLRLDDVALIPESVHNRMSGTHIKEDDILLNITGASIGRCSLVPNSFKEGNVSQHVAIIRLFRPEMREFIHLSLISPFFQKLIDNVQVGVSREGLSMQSLKLFPMLIPPIAEQHRIVAKVDELMGLCDRLQSAQQNRESQRDRLVAASLHEPIPLIYYRE